MIKRIAAALVRQLLGIRRREKLSDDWLLPADWFLDGESVKLRVQNGQSNILDTRIIQAEIRRKIDALDDIIINTHEIKTLFRAKEALDWIDYEFGDKK